MHSRKPKSIISTITSFITSRTSFIQISRGGRDHSAPAPRRKVTCWPVPSNRESGSIINIHYNNIAPGQIWISTLLLLSFSVLWTQEISLVHVQSWGGTVHGVPGAGLENFIRRAMGWQRAGHGGHILNQFHVVAVLHYDDHQIECTPQLCNCHVYMEKHYNNINIIYVALMAGLRHHD